MLTIGYNYFDYHFVQIGLGSIRGDIIPPKNGQRQVATGPYWNSLSMAIELRLDSLSRGRTLVGTPLSYWSNALFELFDINWLVYGIHAVPYFNLGDDANADGALIMRPEIGLIKFFPFMSFKGGFINLVYGYNLPVINQTFKGYNTHNLAIRLYLVTNGDPAKRIRMQNRHKK